MFIDAIYGRICRGSLYKLSGYRFVECIVVPTINRQYPRRVRLVWLLDGEESLGPLTNIKHR